jgi:HicB family
MMFKCKRIIGGKTYNTETAAQIHGWNGFNDERGINYGTFLFQTRFGAFFLFDYEDDDHETITPFTSEEAQQWLEKETGNSPKLVELFFGEMPEAGSGEIKFTLRLPESLRDRLAARAKANEQSLNAWIVKCLESCAADSPERT